MQRNRGHFLLFLVSVLVLGLLIGNSLSGYVAAQTGTTYSDLEIFSDALSIVQSEYVDQVPTKTLIYDALEGMLSGLDPHSQFMRPDIYKELKVETEGHFGGLGIVISLDENKMLTVVSPIEDTPAFKAGVQAGDKIYKIDGESTEGVILEEAVKKLRGPKGSKVALTVLRLSDDQKTPPQELEFVLTREDIQIRSVSYEMLKDKVARIRIREFSELTAVDLHKALEDLKKLGMRSLVIDLRNNPGGLLNVAADAADEFFDKGQLLVYTESRHPEQNLKFKAKTKATINPDVPIVVLVNAGSASASEIVAGALKDTHRAVIMGEKSFGKGSVQSIIPLSDGSALRLTTAKYLTPAGNSINGVGIQPDIEVKMTKEQMTQLMTTMDIAGTVKKDNAEKPVDIQLQRAVELLQGYDIFKTIEQNISVAKMNMGPTENQADQAASQPADKPNEAAPATQKEEKLLLEGVPK
jgi:carboxyl-terminal processing protease